MGVVDRTKRVVLGRALRTGGREQRELRPREGLAVFGSDALSSNAYATQEVLMVLSLGGVSLYAYGPAIAAAVVIVVAVVVASYRQVVREYPSGGGDYDVAQANLGERVGTLVASAALVDFALTLSVSVSAVMANVVSLLPDLDPHRALIAIGLIALLALANLRGVRESNPWFIISTYSFVAAILITALVAGLIMVSGGDVQAESANWTIQQEGGLTGVALILVLARSFSSGSIAVTGVESVGSGVPEFRRPRGPNAAKTLVVMGGLTVALFASLTWLALATDVRVTEFDEDLLGLPAETPQKTVIVQVAEAVYPWGIFTVIVVLATVLILLAAANSSFRSFTGLGSILARDGLLPRQLHTRGDRLALSNGIIILAAGAIGLVWWVDARVPPLISLYIIGVFLALTLGQAGMVRHWTARLERPGSPEERKRMQRARILAAFAQVLTAVVLVVAFVSKFSGGAWLVAVVILVLYLLMRAIRAHYVQVQVESAAPDEGARMVLPPRVNAMVLVSRLHKPTMRALAYARATRPTSLEAITVAVDAQEAAALAKEWERRGIPVPLRVLDSPYREINRPVLEYVAGLRRESPRDLLAIYIPEYTVSHWWERLLHNQSASRLRRRLMTYPNVTLVSVPWNVSEGNDSLRPPSSDAEAPRPGSHPPGRSRRRATGVADPELVKGPSLPGRPSGPTL